MYYPYIRQQVGRASRSITVVGHGEVFVEPDIATIQLEVQTISERLREAQQENARIMNNVLQSLYQLGIPRENIQTAAYTIFPRYDFINGEQVFRGYEVTNSISVKISDILQVGTVIDTAVKNGANRVTSIQFAVEDVERPKQEAIVKALENAQVKARTIANALNLQIDPQPVKIIEVENGGQPIPLLKAVAFESVTTPIEGGQISIRSTMRVQYEY
ncbi:SIMPL domain-containing protein [Sporosarcina sp. ACRSL]|uniref:SIMPL domain-containing protein n=1 Tax=Sporosarcina sp. ACRSL TaxID=2918215 RepID=UPI001EF5BCCB|nr:SIMPL domain-containing protein [Sporosarcina sp. ACRSL]MCG7342619.1 SIMPL domain-containing protein [Sporosarcina sp. ACRSL]